MQLITPTVWNLQAIEPTVVWESTSADVGRLKITIPGRVCNGIEPAPGDYLYSWVLLNFPGSNCANIAVTYDDTGEASGYAAVGGDASNMWTVELADVVRDGESWSPAITPLVYWQREKPPTGSVDCGNDPWEQHGADVTLAGGCGAGLVVSIICFSPVGDEATLDLIFTREP